MWVTYQQQENENRPATLETISRRLELVSVFPEGDFTGDCPTRISSPISDLLTHSKPRILHSPGSVSKRAKMHAMTGVDAFRPAAWGSTRLTNLNSNGAITIKHNLEAALRVSLLIGAYQSCPETATVCQGCGLNR